MNQMTVQAGDGPSSERDERRAGQGAFRDAQRELFEQVGLDARSQFVHLEGLDVRTHVFEAGPRADRTPMVFVHGGGAFGAFLAPLMAQFEDRPVIGFDRPGYGLSGEFRYTEENLRGTDVRVLEGVLDELGIEQVDLVGHSMGGYASVVFALDRPARVRRLVLVGACAGFPGASPPLPLRLMTVPVVRRVLQRLGKPGEEGALDVAEIFGERDAIQDYPALVAAMAAESQNPKSSRAMLSEFAAFFSALGWHPSPRLSEDELGAIRQPTLVVWGEYDPIGSPEDFRSGVDAIPDARTETIPAAHAPFLSYPEECARFVEEL